MLTKIKDCFHIYALTAIVFWSLTYIFTRLAMQHFSPATVGFLRNFIASCVFVLLVFFYRIPLPRRADWPYFAAAGASGFFFYMLTFNRGCEILPVTAASLISSTIPVVTALMARVIYKEKLSHCQWLAIFMELSGVALLTLANGTFNLNAGALWVFVSVLFFSAYNLLQRRLSQSYSALQTSAYSVFAGTLMLSVFAPAALPQVQSAQPLLFVYLLIMGVFSSCLAYIAWTRAFAKAKRVSSVSNYLFLSPVLASLLGWWLGGENPAGSNLTGGAIILLGMALFNFGDKLRENFLARSSP